MTITPKALYTGGQLPNGALTLYECPANSKAMIGAATFSNTDTVARLLNVFIVRSGGTALASNTIIGPNRALGSGEDYTSNELPGQLLGPGDTIQASADVANKITCAGISGYEIIT